jgi:hypothetical protein
MFHPIAKIKEHLADWTFWHLGFGCSGAADKDGDVYCYEISWPWIWRYPAWWYEALDEYDREYGSHWGVKQRWQLIGLTFLWELLSLIDGTAWKKQAWLCNGIPTPLAKQLARRPKKKR